MSSPGTILLENVEDIEEDSGNSLFFSRIGECKVGSDGCQGFGCVAVSRTNGLIYLASGTDIYCIESSVIRNLLKKIENSDSVPNLATIFEGPDLRPAFAVSRPVSDLLLTRDGALLTVMCGSEISVYSASDVQNSSVSSLWDIDMNDTVCCIEWEPRENSHLLSVLTEGGDLFLLDVSGKNLLDSCQIDSNVRSFSWKPTGGMMVVASGDFVYLFDVVSRARSKNMQLTSIDVENNCASIEMVDGSIWLGDGSIIVTFQELVDEVDLLVAYMSLTWAGNSFPESEQDVSIHELFPAGVERSVPPKQMLIGDVVPEWGVLVSSHQAIADSHIRVFSSDGVSISFDPIVEDALSIRIPGGPDDAENFVRKIGIDQTSGISCAHPVDATAPDLENLPGVWILTSDGMLRLYALGSLANSQLVTMEPVATKGSTCAFFKETSDVALGLQTALPEDESDEFLEDDSNDEETDEGTPDVFVGKSLETNAVPESAPPEPASGGVPVKTSERHVSDDPEIVYPVSSLSNCPGDIPRIEREFLADLFKSRQLEFQSFKTFALSMEEVKSQSLRDKTNALMPRTRGPLIELSDLQSGFDRLLSSVKEAYSKMEAMPLFQGKQADIQEKDGKPLNASLLNLREALKSQLKSLRFSCEELQETLSSFGESGIQNKGYLGNNPWGSLKKSVHAQGRILKDQVAKVNDLWALACKLGIVSNEILAKEKGLAALPGNPVSPRSQDLLHVSPQHERKQWVSLSPSADIHSPEVNFLSSAGAHHVNESRNQLNKDILERCMSKEGIRRTLISPKTDPGSKLVSSLPTLAPISLPKIPEPRDLYAKYEDKKFALKQPFSTAPKPAAKESKPALSGSGGGGSASSQPPLPSFSMQQQSKGLMDAVGAKPAAKESKPALSGGGGGGGSASSQPPLPSLSMQQQSKGLMDAVGAKPAAKESKPALSGGGGGGGSTSSQPPLPSLSMQQQSKSLLDAVGTGNEVKISQNLSPFKEISTPSSRVSQGKNLDAAKLSGAPKESSQQIGHESSVFGKDVVQPTETQKDTSLVGGQAFAKPNTQGLSNAQPFGVIQGSPLKPTEQTQGQTSSMAGLESAPSISSESTASLTASSPGLGQSRGVEKPSFPGTLLAFGQPSTVGQTSGFGQPSTVGQTSVFGQPSTVGQTPGFGQPSGFGQASPFGQASAFGQASTIGQQSGFGQASTFGQASAVQNTASPGLSSGFGQSSSFGQSPAFGQSTPGFSTLAQGQGSGFASMANQGKTEFASFAQMGQGTSSFATNPAKSSNSSMWQARK